MQNESQDIIEFIQTIYKATGESIFVDTEYYCDKHGQIEIDYKVFIPSIQKSFNFGSLKELFQCESEITKIMIGNQTLNQLNERLLQE